MLASPDEEDRPESFAEQRPLIDRRSMSDRLLSGRGQYLSKAAKLDKQFYMCGFEGTVYTLYSSLAQSVEHAAVNRSVVGSSPTGGVF